MRIKFPAGSPASGKTGRDHKVNVALIWFIKTRYTILVNICAGVWDWNSAPPTMC